MVDFKNSDWDKTTIKVIYPEQNMDNTTDNVFTFRHTMQNTTLYNNNINLITNKNYKLSMWIKTNDSTWNVLFNDQQKQIITDNTWNEIEWNFTSNGTMPTFQMSTVFNTGNLVSQINKHQKRINHLTKLNKIKHKKTIDALNKLIIKINNQIDIIKTNHLNSKQYSFYNAVLQLVDEDPIEHPIETFDVIGLTGATGPTVSPFSSVYEEKINAVCNIVIEARDGNYYSGTGFFISANGYICTAAHVVVGGTTVPEPYAKKIYVHISPENTIHLATIIGVDRLYDVALIKVNLTNRTFFEWQNSRDIKLGSHAVAIGQPLGTHIQSITCGIVSDNKCQDYSWMPESLLVDFEIIGGNSGGPVVNIYGKVIGLVSWGLTEEVYSLNGAITSFVAEKVVNTIKQKYEATNRANDYPTGYIGLNFEPVSMYDLIDIKLRLPNLNLKLEGVKILAVSANSPASRAGLKINDIIIKAGNKIVGKANNQEPFGTIVHFTPIGQTLSLTVLKSPNYTSSIVNVIIEKIPGKYDFIFSDTQSIQKLHSKKHIIFS